MKRIFTVMLVLLALVSLTLGSLYKAVAATAATLGTTYKYEITNVNSGYALAISSPTLTAGSTAIQTSYTGSSSQLWHFIPTETSGYYKLVQMGSGEVLGVSGASTSSGASVLQWADNGTTDHWWEAVLIATGEYEIINYNSGLVLDVASGSTSSGASIVQTAYTGAKHQLWKLTATSTAAYVGPGTVSGDVTIHDPSIVKTSAGVYYSYSTSLTTPYNGIEMATSTNRTAWTDDGYAFSSLPGWISTYNGSTGMMWAPDVSYHNSKYYMYYAVSTSGSQTSAIGLATSTTGAPGSWTDQGKVWSSSSSNTYNAIDPGLIVDASGNWWLSFGSWWDGIYMISLNSSTGFQSSSNTTVYHLAERLVTSRGLEGAYIYYYDGYYYLFASEDVCCSSSATYHEIVGRSSTANGTYYDEGGVAMLSGGGTIILSSHSNYVGTGGASVFTDTDGPILVYHYYDSSNSYSPTLGINRLGWSSTYWPYVE